MAQEHNTNPLPQGRYWIDIADSPEGQIEDFNDWLKSSGSIKVETSELDSESKPPSQFVIFKIVGPAAFFDASRFGFPNKAPASVKSREQAEQLLSPTIETPGIEQALEFAKTAGKVAFGLVLLKLGIELFRKRG